MNTITIPDIQNLTDARNLPIGRVGIKDLKHPLSIETRAGTAQHTVGTFNLYASLSAHQKGTHMSRFIEVLHEAPVHLTLNQMAPWIDTICQHLGSQQAYFEVSFPFFISKKAPITGVESLLDYQVTLIAEGKPGAITQSVQLIIPVTTLCPCSKKISDAGAHNQRAHITLKATLTPKSTIHLEDIIQWIEEEASCELFTLLKRADEKFVTEQAYDNPKFVEDIVRDMALMLAQKSAIATFHVSSENFESIHNHSAYACIEG